MVNDYWQIAIEEGCDFIHLGQEDLEEADLDQIRRANMRLGVSTHDDEDLRKAIALNPEYIAFGPVYPTILKKMKWSPQGLSRVSKWKQALGDIPLVAIGGMKVEFANDVFDAGADIISVLTDITLNVDPVNRVKEWLTITRGQGIESL
ncbi:thiamine phosphate synthase [Xenorhabdus japonica]|uniref:thiamine phosphate synthase n=1 Tax=Xenorhabdus japonica TaxID=53341 RepID=UPI001C311EE5|nr:thiamine phosphate synthase [Xenorhabdus japonica]